MKKPLLITLWIIVLLVLGIGAWAYYNWKTYAPEVYITETEKQTETGTTTEVSTVDTKNDTVTPGAKTFTLVDVAMHNNTGSCYTVISGAVYDLTMWVAMHPGGKQAILSLCGVDGTARFTAKHGGDAKPNSTLARFKIGLLVQ